MLMSVDRHYKKGTGAAKDTKLQQQIQLEQFLWYRGNANAQDRTDRYENKPRSGKEYFCDMSISDVGDMECDSCGNER